MKLTAYHRPIRRLQLDFASRLSQKRMLAGRPRGPKTITDNSEPWMENPDSVADYIEIATRVNELVKKWAPQQTPSSEN